MKLQHDDYANQKLQTEWGMIEVGADGSVDVPEKAGEFFAKTLKFRPLDAAAKKAATPVAPKKADDEELIDIPDHEVAASPKAAEPEKSSQFSGKKSGSKK